MYYNMKAMIWFLLKKNEYTFCNAIDVMYLPVLFIIDSRTFVVCGGGMLFTDMLRFIFCDPYRLR